MPTIDTKNKKITYDEKDWLSGLHPQAGTKTIPQKFGKYSMFQRNFNPFINLGYAQNGYLNTDITDGSYIKHKLVGKAEDDGDSDFYAVEAKDKLHTINNYNTASSTPHSITSGVGGNATRCFNICKYRISSTDYYFYNWVGTGGTPQDIGRYTPGTATFDDDFMSTVPTGAGYAFTNQGAGANDPMIVGHDDILYIGGSNYLASYDGPNNTFVQQRLILPTNFKIYGLVKYPSRSLAIFTQGSGICKVFFWDYLSDDPYDVKDINDFDLLSAFEYQGSIACMTKGKEGYHKCWVFNGSIFKELFRFNSSFNGKTIIGPVDKGVCVNNNEIWFNVADQDWGYICVYGNNLGLKDTLNIVAKNDVYVSDSVSYEPGIISIGRDGETFVSSGNDYYGDDGSSNQYLDKTKYTTEGHWRSDLVDMGDERIRITGITIYFADEFTGGRTIALTLKDRYTTYDIQGITALGTVTSTNRIFRALPVNNTDGTPIPPLDGIGINLAWGTGAGSSVTPIINKIIIDYEPIKIN